MYQLINAPLDHNLRNKENGWNTLRRTCASMGLDGIEGIWAGEDIPSDIPPELLVGYHLTFLPDWLDFYREDKAALRRKFGSLENAYNFYGGSEPERLIRLYREDLARARQLGAKYVVYHVSDVSIEESYTFQWLHTDEEVFSAAAEIANLVLDDSFPFEFLIENQWWAGLTFTDPEKTAQLLEAVNYSKKGLMLDTGHLMVTNPKIRTQAQALRYLNAMLDIHGDLCGMIRGIHLHQSLSGAYLRRAVGILPELPEDFLEKYAASYSHIQQIDRHRPWTNSEISRVVERIHPEYLTHEVAGYTMKERFLSAHRQVKTLKKGFVLCR